MHSFWCIFLYKKLNKPKKISVKIPIIKIPSFLCSAYLFFVLLLSTLSLFLVCFCVFAKMLSIVCGCNLARSAHRHRHPHRHHRHAFGSKFSHFFFIGIPSFSLFFSLFLLLYLALKQQRLNYLKVARARLFAVASSFLALFASFYSPAFFVLKSRRFQHRFCVFFLFLFYFCLFSFFISLFSVV